jgi:hypothetical protein
MKKKPLQNKKPVADPIAGLSWFASDHAERYSIFSVRTKYPLVARRVRRIE